jgi:hypothetical protein
VRRARRRRCGKNGKKTWKKGELGRKGIKERNKEGEGLRHERNNFPLHFNWLFYTSSYS